LSCDTGLWKARTGLGPGVTSAEDGRYNSPVYPMTNRRTYSGVLANDSHLAV
jgi:hypothetical protein